MQEDLEIFAETSFPSRLSPLADAENEPMKVAALPVPVVMEKAAKVIEKIVPVADSKPKRESQLVEVLRKINDPHFDVIEVSRLIAVEIAEVTLEMHLAENLGQDPVKLKTYSEVVKSLRELAKQLESTDFRNRKDVLNFDGPKFSYAVSQINNCWERAMKKAGVSEQLRNSTLTQYRDIVAEAETSIRKGINDIEG